MVHRQQLIACVVRQYGTGLYRACVSLARNQTFCLSTHPDEAGASETINLFLDLFQKGKIKQPEDFLSFTGHCAEPKGLAA